MHGMQYTDRHMCLAKLGEACAQYGRQRRKVCWFVVVSDSRPFDENTSNAEEPVP